MPGSSWVGTISATAGDNVGYLLGYSLGRRLLRKWKHIFHVDDEDLQAGEELIRRRGALTIFWLASSLEIFRNDCDET
jgi:membrane protein DedA with SNARE-associated domain